MGISPQIAPQPEPRSQATRPKPKPRCLSRYEAAAQNSGHELVAGVDEVGRGALFGGVVAAACILPVKHRLPGLTDSKLLTPEQRAAMAIRIQAQAIGWAVGSADAFEIDHLNIYQATRLAMKRAVEALQPLPHYILIDALRLDVEIPQQSLIKGDLRCRCIAAASILAKVTRDRCLERWAEVYPGYGLEQHKGYSTPLHLEALSRLGATPLHRTSFAPVRACGGERWKL